MVYMQQKVSQQVNRPAGKKAHPTQLAAIAANKQRPRVRVEPTNEAHRHVLKHPNGMAFRNEGDVEWPYDRFTERRLREGVIRVVEIVGGEIPGITVEKKESNPRPPREPREPKT